MRCELGRGGQITGLRALATLSLAECPLLMDDVPAELALLVFSLTSLDLSYNQVRWTLACNTCRWAGMRLVECELSSRGNTRLLRVGPKKVTQLDTTHFVDHGCTHAVWAPPG